MGWDYCGLLWITIWVAIWIRLGIIMDYPGHRCPLRISRRCRAPPISKRNKCRVRPGTYETGAALGIRNFLPRSGRKPLPRSRQLLRISVKKMKDFVTLGFSTSMAISRCFK